MIEVKVGDKFIATIDGEKNIKGVIQIQNGCIYLCQNDIAGAGCNDKLGYRCSWYASIV